MNAKKAKKLRQFYRRDIRDEARKQANFLALAIKAKPKYYPRWLWMLGGRIYFNKRYLKKLYK